MWLLAGEQNLFHRNPSPPFSFSLEVVSSRDGVQAPGGLSRSWVLWSRRTTSLTFCLEGLPCRPLLSSQNRSSYSWGIHCFPPTCSQPSMGVPVWGLVLAPPGWTSGRLSPLSSKAAAGLEMGLPTCPSWGAGENSSCPSDCLSTRAGSGGQSERKPDSALK